MKNTNTTWCYVFQEEYWQSIEWESDAYVFQPGSSIKLGFDEWFSLNENKTIRYVQSGLACI
jgi:hypothetical protein